MSEELSGPMRSWLAMVGFTRHPSRYYYRTIGLATLVVCCRAGDVSLYVVDSAADPSNFWNGVLATISTNANRTRILRAIELLRQGSEDADRDDPEPEEL